MGEDAAVFGKKKYLWGNVPAFDMLRLDSNEGSDYNDNIRILCAGMFSSLRLLLRIGIPFS